MANQAPRAMPEEWFSIIGSVVAAIVAPLFIRYANWDVANHGGLDWEPQNRILWTVPLWIGFFYVIIQMAFLLVSRRARSGRSA